MKTVVGVFTSHANAERAVEQLHAAGFGPSQISLLTPGTGEEQIHNVRTSDTEQPGMGAAMGGVVGGALGLAAASLVIPGVGPVVALGVAAGALMGAGGALAGAAAGQALETEMGEGLPADEIFFYEDALRRGRSVVIAMARDETQEEAARTVMVHTRAESLDAARESWWLGLRDAGEADYLEESEDFGPAELVHRHGFEAALEPAHRGRTYEEALGSLSRRYPDAAANGFRRGFERGQAYYLNLTRKYTQGGMHG